MNFETLRKRGSELTQQLTPQPVPPPAVTGTRKGANTPAEALPNPESEEAQLARLKPIFDKHRHRLLGLPGVSAIDIGYKIKDGTFLLNKLAIRLHVERKIKIDQEAEKLLDPIQRSEILANILGRCKDDETDVIHAVYGPYGSRNSFLLEDPTSTLDLFSEEEQEQLPRFRVNPLAGGISIGSAFSSGTLGALVWDRKDGSVCILSNWHILAGRPNASVGDPCFQPGLFDQGLGGDVVARLKRWSFGRHSDAALAQLDTNRRYCPGEILALPGAIGEAIEPKLRMVVYKIGRSTGFTAGFIDGLHFTSRIAFGNGIVQSFEDQIHIATYPLGRPLTEPGDSGAIWVAEDPEGLKAVGLHFAGDLASPSFGEFAVANRMVEVQKQLKFSFRPLFVDEIEPTSDPVPRQPFLVPVQNVSGFSGPIGFGAKGGLGPQPVPELKEPPRT
jgi:endonuclease G, mitochondrial